MQNMTEHYRTFLCIVEFHEIGRTLLEGLHEESLGIVEFCEVGRNFLEVLHEILLVVVLYEVGTLPTCPY